MTELSDAALRTYERRIPGARDGHLTSAHAQYAQHLLRHLLAVVDLAMEIEKIPTDVRQRVLMVVTIGQPTPPDTEEIRRLTGIEAENIAQNLAALGLPPVEVPGAWT